MAGPAMSLKGNSGGQASDLSANKENERMRRFNEALDRFLELMDERATTSNFQTALPHLDGKVLDSAREQFVVHLKDAIKMEKDRLVESYALGQRLSELEDLTQEADARNEEARRHGTTAAALYHDAWRPKVDLATAIHAPLVSQSRQRVDALELELEELLQENKEEQVRLRQSIADEQSQRENARRALDLLEESLAGLQSSTEDDVKLRSMVDTLLEELGPRAVV